MVSVETSIFRRQQRSNTAHDLVRVALQGSISVFAIDGWQMEWFPDLQRKFWALKGEHFLQAVFSTHDPNGHNYNPHFVCQEGYAGLGFDQGMRIAPSALGGNSEHPILLKIFLRFFESLEIRPFTIDPDAVDLGDQPAQEVITFVAPAFLI